MKKLLLSLAVASIAAAPMSSFANETPAAPMANNAMAPQKMAPMATPQKPNPNKEFARQLAHSNFMPILMKATLQHHKDLHLTATQLKTLKDYKQKNTPAVMANAKEVLELEKQARDLALKDAPKADVIALGEKSLKLRHDIMESKIDCRDFVKSVLTPEQYKKVTGEYMHFHKAKKA